MKNQFSIIRLKRWAPVAVACASVLTSCGGMSDQEKRMIGKYYIPALSDSRPMLELKSDRSSKVRAIRPGELSFYVEGTWAIKDDSLIIVNDGASITIEDGDPALIGSVARRLAYPIMSFDDTVLRIERSGIQYDYYRRLD